MKAPKYCVAPPEQGIDGGHPEAALLEGTHETQAIVNCPPKAAVCPLEEARSHVAVHAFAEGRLRTRTWE